MRVGERAALGTVVEAFYSPFPACNYRLAKALCPENCLSHLKKNRIPAAPRWNFSPFASPRVPKLVAPNFQPASKIPAAPKD